MLMVNGEKVTNVLHTILPFRTYRVCREVGVSSLCVCSCCSTPNTIPRTTKTHSLCGKAFPSRVSHQNYTHTHRHTSYWRRTYFIQRDIFRHTYALWAFITMLCVWLCSWCWGNIFMYKFSKHTIHHRRHRWSPPPLPTPSSFKKWTREKAKS